MQVAPAPRRRLSAHELIDRSNRCPICLSPAHREAVFRVQADPDVHLLACLNCGGFSASHMPMPQVLEEYYASYYSGSDHEITFSEPTRFARHVVNSLPASVFSERVRILDYGGGDGSLAKAVAERLIGLGRTSGAEILVVDYASHTAVSTSQVLVRHQLPSAPIDDRYDLILASAILEHIPDLHALLRMLYSAIAPSGSFYARTPYVVPLLKRFARLDFTYPAHVHDMGVTFWNQAPHTFGWDLQVVVSRPSVVANTVRKDPLRALAAIMLKMPAYLEGLLSPRGRTTRFWHFVGGWEIVFQRR
jgi:SAM-dependent methyltransferase